MYTPTRENTMIASSAASLPGRSPDQNSDQEKPSSSTVDVAEGLGDCRRGLLLGVLLLVPDTGAVSGTWGLLLVPGSASPARMHTRRRCCDEQLLVLLLLLLALVLALLVLRPTGSLCNKLRGRGAAPCWYAFVLLHLVAAATRCLDASMSRPDPPAGEQAAAMDRGSGNQYGQRAVAHQCLQSSACLSQVILPINHSDAH